MIGKTSLFAKNAIQQFIRHGSHGGVPGEVNNFVSLHNLIDLILHYSKDIICIIENNFHKFQYTEVKKVDICNIYRDYCKK